MFICEKFKKRLINLTILGFFLILFINNFLTAEIRINPQVACQDMLEIFHFWPIPIVKQKRSPLPDEVYKAGKTYSLNDKFPPIEDMPEGIYLYIIDTNLNLVVSRLVLEENTWASHRALYNNLTEELGYFPKILAGGEFHILNGGVQYVNNQSGSFPNNRINLFFSINRLILADLYLSPDIKIDDVSSSGGTHFNTYIYIDIIKEVQQDIILRRYVYYFKKIFKTLSEKYPSSIPGWVDTSHLETKSHRNFILLSQTLNLIAEGGFMYAVYRLDQNGVINRALNIMSQAAGVPIDIHFGTSRVTPTRITLVNNDNLLP